MVCDHKGPHIEDYLKEVEKEAESWKQWDSVEALSREQAAKVLNDKILAGAFAQQGVLPGQRQRTGASAAQVQGGLLGPPGPRPLQPQPSGADSLQDKRARHPDDPRGGLQRRVWSYEQQVDRLAGRRFNGFSSRTTTSGGT